MGSNIVWSPTKGWHDGPEVKVAVVKADPARGRLFAGIHAAAVKVAERPEPSVGQCVYCGALEVTLIKVIGFKDYSSIGESDRYPLGAGCEICS